MAAIFDFEGGRALQVVSERPFTARLVFSLKKHIHSIIDILLISNVKEMKHLLVKIFGKMSFGE